MVKVHKSQLFLVWTGGQGFRAIGICCELSSASRRDDHPCNDDEYERNCTYGLDIVLPYVLIHLCSVHQKWVEGFLFVYVPSLLGTINILGMSWNHEPTFFPYILFVFCLVSARLVCCPCDSMFAFFDRMIILESQHYWPYPPQVDIVSAPNGRAPEWSRQHLNSHGISVGFIAEICKEDLGITCTQCQLTA